MIRTFLTALAALAVTSCGFQPAYAPSNYSEGAISIPQIKGRTGHYLRQELVRSIGHGVPGVDSGRLEIELVEGIARLNFKPDQAASRSDYVAQSNWVLYDASGDQIAFGDSVEAASFNYANAAFADVTAQSAAQERVAILLARTIRQDLIQQIGGFDRNRNKTLRCANEDVKDQLANRLPYRTPRDPRREDPADRLQNCSPDQSVDDRSVDQLPVQPVDRTDASPAR